MNNPRKLTKKEMDEFNNYKIKIKNYHDIIENSSAEHELIKNNYIILYRIVAFNKDKSNLNILKCINRLGQHVYIIIDNGYLPSRSKDLEYNEIDDIYMIPLSIKAGILDCIELQINGIIFDSEGTLCIVKRNNNLLNLEEKTYNLYNETQNIMNECIPHPLLNLSDIKEDPETMLEITDTIIKKIRSEFYNKIIMNLNSFSNNVKNLNNIINEYNNLILEIKNKMDNDFKELEDYDRKYTKFPPTLDENIRNHKLVKYNMKKMNESFLEFVSLNSGLYEENKNLSSIIDKINDLLQFSKNEFSYLGYVKDEN